MKYKAEYSPIWGRDLFLHNDDGLVHYRPTGPGGISVRKMDKEEFRVWSNDILDNSKDYDPIWINHVLYMRDVVFGRFEDFIV